MPNYPALETLPPPTYGPDDVRAAEDALRQLAVVDELLKRCDRCKIPVSELRKDCDGLCEFFENFLSEHKGQGAPLPHAIG